MTTRSLAGKVTVGACWAITVVAIHFLFGLSGIALDMIIGIGVVATALYLDREDFLKYARDVMERKWRERG